MAFNTHKNTCTHTCTHTHTYHTHTHTHTNTHSHTHTHTHSLTHTHSHTHTHTHLPLTHAQQNSVPHLKTRLQLQHAIMKELLQRQAAEKQQQQITVARQLPQTQATPLPTTSTPAPSPSPSVGLPQTTQGKSVVSNPPSMPSTHSTLPAKVQVANTQLQQAKVGNTSSDPITIPPTSNASAAIVVRPAQLTTALQQQLSTALNNPAFQQQVFNQLPKNIRDPVAKRPPEQQKFVYAHHLRRLQLLKQQAQQNSSGAASTGGGDNKVTAASGVPLFPPNPTTGVVASPQMVLEKQQQLVKQQQQGTFVIGGSSGKGASFLAGGKSVGMGGVTTVTSVTTASPSAGAGKSTQQVLSTTGGVGGKISFANMKLGAPPGSALAATQQASMTGVSSTIKKERSKGSKHKDGNVGEE